MSMPGSFAAMSFQTLMKVSDGGKNYGQDILLANFVVNMDISQLGNLTVKRPVKSSSYTPLPLNSQDKLCL